MDELEADRWSSLREHILAFNDAARMNKTLLWNLRRLVPAREQATPP
jgi:hypothetical protein